MNFYLNLLVFYYHFVIVLFNLKFVLKEIATFIVVLIKLRKFKELLILFFFKDIKFFFNSAKGKTIKLSKVRI